MPKNEVYANTREVSCKAAKGKAVCAFPDTCLTPPPPPGVPIPYPNTGFASDTSRGSRSVKISGREVMLKDKSYFKTSTGDEAGCAPKKGVITSKIKGKIYFNSWSMNVIVEGENVVRHLDVTTHNHASKPGQTPIWPYLDESAVSKEIGPCKDYITEAKTNCARHAQRNATGTLKITQTMKAMCRDGKCKEARKCMLSPYKPSRCCKGHTPHHIVPVHCFMPPGERKRKGPRRYKGCEGYDPKAAPCVCVEGKTKIKDHGKIHAIFDPKEDKKLVNGKAGSWSYTEAATAGVDSTAQVTGCDPKCLRKQVDAYHKKNQDENGQGPNISGRTRLRADSTGGRPLGKTVPQISTGTASRGQGTGGL